MNDSSTTASAVATASTGVPNKAGKRIGRPPKTTVVATALGPGRDEMDSNDVESRTLTQSPTFSECRRSSRKKITKFDVLDLLNKNRKPHKIQIEARIDSNAPPPPPAVAKPNASPGMPAGKAIAAQVQASSPVNRRFSMFETTTAVRQMRLLEKTIATRPLLHGATTPPMVSLDMFARPKPTQSLIVAQVSSGNEDSNASRASSAKALPSAEQAPPSTDKPRKRGRPRKTQPTSPEVAPAITPTAGESGADGKPLLLRNISCSDSDTSSTTGSAEYDKLKLTPLRVALKRIAMPPHRDSYDSAESLKFSPRVADASTSSTEQPAAPMPRAPSVEALASVQDENAVDANLVASDDSDSQIIFVQINGEKPSLSPATLPVCAVTTPTEQRSFQQFSQEQSQLETAVLPSPTATPIMDADETNSNSVLNLDDSTQTSTKRERTCTSTRRSQRATKPVSVCGASIKMTLEETFAEIAAQSSKRILQPAAMETAASSESVPPIEVLEQTQAQAELSPKKCQAKRRKTIASQPRPLKENDSNSSPAPQLKTEKEPNPRRKTITSQHQSLLTNELNDHQAQSLKPDRQQKLQRRRKTIGNELMPLLDNSSQMQPAKQSKLLRRKTIDSQPKPPKDNHSSGSVVQSLKPDKLISDKQPRRISISSQLNPLLDNDMNSSVAPLLEPQPQPRRTTIASPQKPLVDADSNNSLAESLQPVKQPQLRRKTITSQHKPLLDDEVNSSQAKPMKPAEQPMPKAQPQPRRTTIASEPADVQSQSQSSSVRPKQPKQAKDREKPRKDEHLAKQRHGSHDKEKDEAKSKSGTSAKKVDTEQQAASPADAGVPHKKTSAETQKKPTIASKHKAEAACSSKGKEPKPTKTDHEKRPFVDSDALFKAMDKANAQMRMEEKCKKKLKHENKKEQRSQCSTPTLPKAEQPAEVAAAVVGQRKLSNSADFSPMPTAKEPECGADQIHAKSEQQLPTPLSRRNTTSEEIVPSNPAGHILSKRRYSVHPNAESPVSPANLKLSPQWQPSVETTTVLRQDSLDSSCSSKTSRKPKSKSSHAGTESPDATSASSKLRCLLESSSMHTPAASSPVLRSPESEAPDPLKDIAKFIEDGVNLLKRAYKLEEPEAPLSLSSSPKAEFAELVANIETPALTPECTPAPSPSPSSSAQPSDAAESTASSSGVRRSHRIKQKPQGPKASVGRGVVRDKERLAPDEACAGTLSMQEQLLELAHIESINEQFLRNEGLHSFQLIRENYYRCARQVSQENAEMQCDCFLTGDEEAQGHLCCGTGCINRMLMIECGPLCTNGDRCTNKRFQKRQCWPCRVFRTEKKGCGITAELQIPAGEFIMEYVGEVIDSEEFERRQHLYSRDKNRHYYFMALRGEAIIDATAKGNISRYINHSCDPNAETQKWTVNGELRIGFFSRKTILPGEEITFDYQYQRYGRDAQRCYCEAANCRGWIGGEPDSDEGEQQVGDSYSEEEYDEELEPQSNESPELAQRRKIVNARKSKEAKPRVPSKLKRPGSKLKQPKPKDREYKVGRWLRGANEKSTRKPSKVKFRVTLEDPDVLEELSLLSRCGLKNQVDTLRFSRCMVRAKLLQTRINLLEVLTRGELPCRRLFLDYHGLRLLHAWMNESGGDSALRPVLLEALESLPIPNKTMLNDSRVYQSVKVWCCHNDELAGRTTALLHKWDALPEIFRIPKRERIQQMKEHEREADRQYVATALEDSNSATAVNSDRYRQDRFRRDTTNRYSKPKPAQMSGNNTICTITTQPKDGRNTPNNLPGSYKSDVRRRSDNGSSYERPKQISKELRRELFERKVAQDEAEKRVSSEDWREHEVRCEYFGVDITTDPKLLPQYHNLETDEWFNGEDMLVPTPLRCGNGTEPEILADEPPAVTDSSDYKLPASLESLPPSWHYNITGDGHIYYYNLRDRIPQWEPPNAQQRQQTLNEQTPEEPQEPTDDELLDIDIEHVGDLSPKALNEYIEHKVRERRERRRRRLVSVRTISPRREEDRVYNQLESRKYKENKEKIRRRKEVYRRRRLTFDEQLGSGHIDVHMLDSTQPLPIQGYLFSSDEDSDADANACNSQPQPLIDGTVDSDKNVDDLDMLNKRHQQRRNLPMPPLDLEPSTSKSALAALATLSKKPLSLPMPPPPLLPLPENEVFAIESIGKTTPTLVKRKLPLPPHTPEHKRHRQERDKRRKTMASSTSGREASEKFRAEISGHVAEFLRPYRKDSCQMGRITCDDDYKFLVKRLSHHITTKEMRYCDATGNPLACTESVKHKSYDFINQYMHKKGRVYKRPIDEPEY